MVSDRGTGFDEREAMAGGGLGLISMRERLQLLGGALIIESKPGQGTTIRAHVPIQTNFVRLTAAR
jgi:signal transduction histidine kinase